MTRSCGAFTFYALTLILFLAFMLPMGCDNKDLKPAAQTDSKSETSHSQVEQPQRHGKWLAQSATLGGKPFPDDVTKSISLTLTGDQYRVLVGDKPDNGTCTVDVAQTPNRMKIMGTEGPNAGKTFLAIFDFPDADKMRVCYDLSGNHYPTVFESTAENGLYLVSYSRQP
jgi:uncharacterized protein (TIGR03067 family)